MTDDPFIALQRAAEALVAELVPKMADDRGEIPLEVQVVELDADALASHLLANVMALTRCVKELRREVSELRGE